LNRNEFKQTMRINIPYYPNAYFTKEQSTILRSAIFYFQQLHLLALYKTVYHRTGIGEFQLQVYLLKQGQLLNLIAPEAVRYSSNSLK